VVERPVTTTPEDADEGRVVVTWMTVDRRPDAAGRLLAHEVARVTGVPADEVRIVRACPRCGSPDHGTPVVVGSGRSRPSVSLSRAEGIALVAVSTAGPVGVDVERLDVARFAGFDSVALHASERALTVEARAKLWARKESLLKATGDALHLDPELVRVSDADQAPRLVEWPSDRVAPVAQLLDLQIVGYAACVTVLSKDVPRFTTGQAGPEALLS
jgi:4'-phosphopantetheinyl transferase